MTANISTQEAYITGLNRYPDPNQIGLKQLICNLRNSECQPNGILTPDNVFCGVGSDEAIDSAIRAFCKPGLDKIMVSSPTYGFYKVMAAVNDVEVVDVPLELPSWQIHVEIVLSLLFRS